MCNFFAITQYTFVTISVPLQLAVWLPNSHSWHCCRPLTSHLPTSDSQAETSWISSPNQVTFQQTYNITVIGFLPQIVFFVSFKYASNCLFISLVIFRLYCFDAVQIQLIYWLPRVFIGRIVILVLEPLSPVTKVRGYDKERLIVLEIRQ